MLEDALCSVSYGSPSLTAVGVEPFGFTGGVAAAAVTYVVRVPGGQGRRTQHTGFLASKPVPFPSSRPAATSWGYSQPPFCG